jgi:large subunit ribosomal protein L25
MEQLELKANVRKITGKKVKSLRREGITPLNLFGSGIESKALQSDTKKLASLVGIAGSARLIRLKIGREKQTRPVLIREVDRDPMSGKLLHASLFQVKMGEKVEVEVPIVLTGEAPVLKEKGNVLLQELDSLSIECLPDRIPGKIEVDLSSLTKPGQIRVKDISLGKEVTVLNDPDKVIVTVTTPRVSVQEEKPPVAEAAAPVPEEKPAETEKREP